jgi:hypothetical protein
MLSSQLAFLAVDGDPTDGTQSIDAFSRSGLRQPLRHTGDAPVRPLCRAFHPHEQGERRGWVDGGVQLTIFAGQTECGREVKIECRSNSGMFLNRPA